MIAAGLAALAVLPFIRAAGGEPIGDDLLIARDDLAGQLAGGLNRAGFGCPRFITRLSYMLPGSALLNYWIHAVNVLLVYRLVIACGGGRYALAAAAVFAVHPLQAASVCHRAARAGMLSFLFAAIACIILVGGNRLAWSVIPVFLYLSFRSKEDLLAYLFVIVPAAVWITWR